MRKDGKSSRSWMRDPVKWGIRQRRMTYSLIVYSCYWAAFSIGRGCFSLRHEASLPCAPFIQRFPELLEGSLVQSQSWLSPGVLVFLLDLFSWSVCREAALPRFQF